ncbi:hypothetical protein B0T17DRAFT_603687 [Bombardia bombarda]|uniref:Antifreeze protein n=1 Tax=Bombardia bombarda TaxID=252184 RepID=A0AA39TVI9_9PEZI|nr:hypothetical protein B0T17DRAFT_603687 [Bombardia bombarda]
MQRKSNALLSLGLPDSAVPYEGQRRVLSDIRRWEKFSTTGAYTSCTESSSLLNYLLPEVPRTSHQTANMRSSSIWTAVLALANLAEANIVDLNTAQSYGTVSGNAGLTSEGSTVITGDLGTTALSVSGFGPGIVTGVQHLGDTAGNIAFTDASNAYSQAKGLTPTADWTVLNDLTDKTVYPGTYYAARTYTLTGALYLDAQGNESATFVFQAGSAILINVGSQVVLTNGAQACNVFWQAGSAATIAVGAAFQGSILAYAGIAVKTGASVNGSLIALTESITLQGNAIEAQAAC